MGALEKILFYLGFKVVDDEDYEPIKRNIFVGALIMAVIGMIGATIIQGIWFSIVN